MATKLAITTNKHKTQTVTRLCMFFSTRNSWGTRVESIGHGDLQSDAKMENKTGYPAGHDR
jgi:hypothetical protein